MPRTPGGREDRFTPQRPISVPPPFADSLTTDWTEPPSPLTTYLDILRDYLEAPKVLRKDPIEATQRAAAGRPYYTAQALTEMMGEPHAPLVEIAEVPPGYLSEQGWEARYVGGKDTPGQIEVRTYPTPLDRSEPLPLHVTEHWDGSLRELLPFYQNLMNTGLPYGSQILAHEYAHHTDSLRPAQERRRYDAAINDYLDRLHRRVGRIGQDYWDPHTQGQSFQHMLNWFPGFDTYRPGWGGAEEFWAESLPWAAQQGLDAIPLELQKFYAPYISSSFDPVVRNIPFNQADSGWPWGFPVEVPMSEYLGPKG